MKKYLIGACITFVVLALIVTPVYLAKRKKKKEEQPKNTTPEDKKSPAPEEPTLTVEPKETEE
ncbi:MAG: OadG family protein [Aureispira sp.]